MDVHNQGRARWVDLAGKHCTRTRGLSGCGGVQDYLFGVAVSNREMSLVSGGYDREVTEHSACSAAEPNGKLDRLPWAPDVLGVYVQLEAAYRCGKTCRTKCLWIERENHDRHTLAGGLDLSRQW
jgi:hypothetical protein